MTDYAINGQINNPGDLSAQDSRVNTRRRLEHITDGTSNVTVRIPPDMSLPVDGDAAIVVHVDDAAAESCASLVGGRYSPEAIATFCAKQLVVVP